MKSIKTEIENLFVPHLFWHSPLVRCLFRAGIGEFFCWHCSLFTTTPFRNSIQFTAYSADMKFVHEICVAVLRLLKWKEQNTKTNIEMRSLWLSRRANTTKERKREFDCVYFYSFYLFTHFSGSCCFVCHTLSIHVPGDGGTSARRWYWSSIRSEETSFMNIVWTVDCKLTRENQKKNWKSIIVYSKALK